MHRNKRQQERLRKKRRRRRLLRRCGGMGMFLLCCLILFGLVRMEMRRGQAVEGESGGGTAPGAADAAAPDLADLYSAHAVLTELSAGETVAQKGGDERIYPASLTKLMTAVLLIERAEDLSETLVLPEDMFGVLQARGASMAGFLPGEEVSLQDLLYGMLLPSGAECSVAAARWLCGSEEDFAELMNRRAGELGMAHTHFENASGLHEKDHYSTAADLSRLLVHALQYEAFRTAFTAARYFVAPTALHPDGITFHSTLSESMRAAGLEDERILGGKTGYTKEAGLCLASLLCVDGREYVLITAGAQGNHQTEPYHVLDAEKVCERLAGRENRCPGELNLS